MSTAGQDAMAAGAASASPTAPPIAAALRGVEKRFGPTVALTGIDLEVAGGSIHALVGENGAGKSTALGILGGRISPTSGEVELLGAPLPHGKPRAAREAGLAVIYQELTIVPALDAAANVFIGHPLSRGGLLAERQMRRAYAELCERAGVARQADGVAVGELSVADQQVIEILRALAFDAQVILFDEPTASLGIAEREALIRLMKSLRADGKTMVFVSHNLDEVLELADEITVFRNGRKVASAERAGWDKGKVVASMIGEAKGLELTSALNDELLEAGEPAARPRREHALGAPVLEVEDLTIDGVIEGIDLTVRAGEILGLGGLVGSGRTSVLRALAGLPPKATGTLRIDGAEVKLPRTVRASRKLGIALLPEDRKGQGLALQMDGATNVLMADMGSISTFGIVRERKAKALAARAAADFGFDPARIGEPSERLSGGNQQKLLLARWAHCKPRVLLVDEPTRGIDIGAKEEVLRALQRMAAEGMSIVVVSSELEEVALISDRVVVLAEGRAMGELDAEEAPIHVSDILGKVFTVDAAAASSAA